MRRCVPSGKSSQAYGNLRRKGTILVLAAIIMIPVFAFVALSVDVGYIAVVKTQLQNAADASALGGAQALIDGPRAARDASLDVSKRNKAAGRPVKLTPADVEVGRWDAETATFFPLVGAAQNSANAVRVTSRLPDEVLKLFFAPVLGIATTKVSASAVAEMQVNRCGRFIGLVDVVVASGYTDSYNSDLGSYHSQTPDNKGHLCSNGPIEVQNALVNGDATPGQGYAVSITGGGGKVTGSVRPHFNPVEAPAVDASAASKFNNNENIPPQFLDNSGNLKVSTRDTLELPGGTYYIDANFSINGEMRLLGPVVFYVTGRVNISGKGLINESLNPSDLTLNVVGDNVNISGSADFYGVIYAPNSTVKISGQAEYFGAALGKHLHLETNGGIHFDESLRPFNEEFERTVLRK